MKTILVGIILFCTAQAGFTQVSDTVSLHQINGYPPKLNECLSVYHDGWSFYFKYSLFEETIQKKKSQMNEKDAQSLNYLFENVTARFKINGGELRLKDWQKDGLDAKHLGITPLYLSLMFTRMGETFIVKDDGTYLEKVIYSSSKRKVKLETLDGTTILKLKALPKEN